MPTKHIQWISRHRTLAALSGYLEVTDEQMEGAIAKLFLDLLVRFSYPLELVTFKISRENCVVCQSNCMTVIP